MEDIQHGFALKHRFFSLRIRRWMMRFMRSYELLLSSFLASHTCTFCSLFSNKRNVSL